MGLRCICQPYLERPEVTSETSVLTTDPSLRTDDPSLPTDVTIDFMLKLKFPL